MHGDKHLTHSSGRQVSSRSDSGRREAADECWNQFQHLELRSGIDLLNSSSKDCSSMAIAKQTSNEKTHQMGPITPVLRSAAKPPKARRAPVSPMTKRVTFQTPAATDSQEGSGKLAPKKTLQKLGRFRVRVRDQGSDLSTILTPKTNINIEY